jgi:hypothetical protein
MPETIALRIIQEPEPGIRPVIVVEDGLRILLIRGEEHAPSLSCGQCAEILVRGISLDCFATRERAAVMGAKAYPFKNGHNLISGTLSISERWYLTGDTPLAQLVLMCPACGAYNDTVASITA